MLVVKVRERGQVTIPAQYRKELGFQENDTLNIVKAGDVLLISHKKIIGDNVSGKFEKVMKSKGLKLNDLLGDLRKQRKKYYQEVYGGKKKS